MATPLQPDVRAAVTQAAKVASAAAIKATLLSLGIDASTPDAVKAMQEDMLWVRHSRLGTSNRSAQYWIVVAGIASSIFTAVVTLAIKQAFFPHVGP